MGGQGRFWQYTVGEIRGEAREILVDLTVTERVNVADAGSFRMFDACLPDSGASVEHTKRILFNTVNVHSLSVITWSLSNLGDFLTLLLT